MSVIFGVISDTHNHKWDTFSTTLPTGINDRLQFILDETWRAAETVKTNGGDTLIHCGDLFHVRGSVSPSVLNPTVDLYQRIIDELKLNVVLLAGNHDLEGKHATKLGNAGEALSGIGVQVISEPFIHHGRHLILIPYMDSCDKLRETIKEQINLIPAELRAQYDLFLHAPLNGVVAGIPDHGLSALELSKLGINRVFCGHYHNHKAFGKVYSVGALTHQTFGDVNSLAGFLLVNDDTVTHYVSNAPRFVDFDPEWSELEEAEYIQGNYVRAKLDNASNDEVEQVRKYLTGLGARSVQIIHVPKTEVSREGGSSIEAGKSIRVSLHEWCAANSYDAAVATEAQSILDEVEAKI